MACGSQNGISDEAVDSLAERQKFARRERGLSQRALAQLASVKQSTLSKIENGTVLHPRGLLAIILALECNPLWLDTGDGDWDDAPQSGRYGRGAGARRATGAKPAGRLQRPTRRRVRDLVVRLRAILETVDEDQRNSILSLLASMSRKPEDLAHAEDIADKVGYLVGEGR